MSEETRKAETAQAEANQKEEKSIEEIVNTLATGTLKLARPFISDDMEIKELKFDLAALSGLEMADALDRGAARDAMTNAFKITNKQALELFITSAGKLNKGVDAEDIRRGLSAMDAVKAAQVGMVFFVGASQMGNGNILKTSQK